MPDLRLPEDHPILGTLAPVLEQARDVSLAIPQLEQVAGWMAYEELPWPCGPSPLLPDCSPAEAADFIFVATSINFAFTDFETRRVFSLQESGRTLYDSDAMMTCLRRAHDQGIPILDGGFLAELEKGRLGRILSGNSPIPLLDRRLEILRENGEVLARHYGGRFHHMIESCPRRLYHDGEGLLERLLELFPSFRDVSRYRGETVVFHKRAQLLWWLLYAMTGPGRLLEVGDLDRLTALADYILPLALRKLGIFRYQPQLEESIENGTLIPADSEEEIEIRAHTIFACELLTRSINRRRPANRQVIAPVVDYRLWSHYHGTHAHHHLTRTTDY